MKFELVDVAMYILARRCDANLRSMPGRGLWWVHSSCPAPLRQLRQCIACILCHQVAEQKISKWLLYMSSRCRRKVDMRKMDKGWLITSSAVLQIKSGQSWRRNTMCCLSPAECSGKVCNSRSTFGKFHLFTFQEMKFNLVEVAMYMLSWRCGDNLKSML